MWKPNIIGPKEFYKTVTPVAFNTTKATATDSDCLPASASYMPYAASATVREDYDHRTFTSPVDGSGMQIQALKRNSFGVFLTPDNDKVNLMFQASVTAVFDTLSAATPFGFWPTVFFGRRATSDTVVSDDTATSNALASHILLPAQVKVMPDTTTSGRVYVNYTGEIFTISDTAGYAWCLGLALNNNTAASLMTIYASEMHISLRKYGTDLGVYRPNRS